MFTLQILDRGQTFLHRLDDQPLLIGRAEDAGLRLREAAVADHHARLEPAGDAARLIALAKVLVNGVAVREKQLELGDRIEIGRAVLVFGRSVDRPAQPDDVLDGVRSGSRRPPPARRSWLVVTAVTAVLLGVVAVIASLPRDDSSAVRRELLAIAQAREAGEVQEAAAAVAELRTRWSGATDDRLVRLEAEQRRIDEVNKAVAELMAGIVDPADTRTYAQWQAELQGIEQKGAPVARIAARIVLGSLWETLYRRAQKPAAGTPKVPPDAVAGVESPATAPAAPKPAPAPRETADRAIADADRLVEQGQFAQALAVLQAEAGQVADAAAVAALQQRADAVLEAARQAMRAVVEQAAALGKAGKHRDAVTALALAQHRFPGGADFQALGKQRDEAEAALAVAAQRQLRETARPNEPAAPDEVARAATLATLRTRLDRIREAEERADFATALQLLRESAELVRERDADFGARLHNRALEAELLLAWHEAVAGALRGGKSLEAALRTGRTATLSSVDGTALVGRTTDGDVKLTWHDVAPNGVAALAVQIAATGRPALGAATLLYKGGEAVLAEPLLAGALRADNTQKEAIDRVIARGRGERYDGRGYSLGKEGFVSVRSIESQKQAQKLLVRLDTVLKAKDRSQREAFFTDVMAQGPDALDAVVVAFKKELESQLKKIDSGPLKKNVDRLAQQRDELDKAREFAKDLIYDEVKYFYPYKPPAVSGERYAEYNRVQAEVDRRVAAVSAIWGDDRLHIKVPATLRSDLDRLDWVAGTLANLGELDAECLHRIEWARALPIGDTIGIADYCRTSSERTELEIWRRVEAYDRLVEPKVSAAVRDQLHVTNAYRAMFRHRPLALCLPICTAAQGHAEEMSRLGYFAHMSPTPGRRTPFDRMKLAGYGFGASENIALHDSAQGAHDAWCHSSGHHRNLLNPAHKECGIGADGRNWVQNFGSGAVFLDDPAWDEAGKGKPARR